MSRMRLTPSAKEREAQLLNVKSWYQLGYENGKNIAQTYIQPSQIIHQKDRDEYMMGFQDGKGDGE